MSKLTSLPERALELASAVGDNLQHAVPSVGQHAGKWLETGAKLGVLKGGARVAGRFVRRNPVLVAAAVAGAGLLWYAAKRRARQAENGDRRGASKAAPRRVEAVAAQRRAPPARRATPHRHAEPRTSSCRTAVRLGALSARRSSRCMRPAALPAVR